MSEAFFSFRGIRGTFLIYVYIHFQYFPAEKLIVHVNGYSFRLSTKVCKENHSSQKRKAPLKNSLFHLVFTDVNTSFVHVVNSPLFPEQQKRFKCRAYPAKPPRTRRKPIFYSSLVLWRRVQGRERS